MSRTGPYLAIEHSLTSKPEFRRVVRRVYEREKARGLTHAQAECLALGYLAKLWLVADLHITEADKLDMLPDEVDQLLGTNGVAQLLGPNYLQVGGPDDAVHLPGWGAHNDPSVRKAAQSTARVRRYRERQAAAALEQECNASALHVTLSGNADGNAPACHGALPRPTDLPTKSKSERAEGAKPPRSQDPGPSLTIHSTPGPGPQGPRFPALAAKK